MSAFSDTLRPMLQEISPELGVTDPVSGTIIAEIRCRKLPEKILNCFVIDLGLIPVSSVLKERI
jgi:hypothetical protein